MKNHVTCQKQKMFSKQRLYQNQNEMEDEVKIIESNDRWIVEYMKCRSRRKERYSIYKPNRAETAARKLSRTITLRMANEGVALEINHRRAKLREFTAIQRKLHRLEREHVLQDPQRTSLLQQMADDKQSESVGSEDSSSDELSEEHTREEKSQDAQEWK